MAGVLKDVIYTDDGPITEKTSVYGFKLLEILEEYMEELVLDNSGY